MKNPNWTTDELILALDLYFKVSPLTTSENSPEIVALSDLLNKLSIHAERLDAEKFRNPNSVYMKLCNFLRLDPSYIGAGLKAGSHKDEEVWKGFANDKSRLASVAAAIRASAQGTAADDDLLAHEQEEVDEATEGTILTRLHRIRERNVELVLRKKAKVLKEQRRLQCEVCEFDFREQFGDLGEGFIECHHTSALSKLLPGQKTKLSDLALVCANCHRMLHRGKPWPTIDQLRAMISKHPVAALEEFGQFLRRLSAQDTSMVSARLRRGAENQIDFLRICHDRRTLERFYVTLSRYGNWAETLADELGQLAEVPQGSTANGSLSQIAGSIRMFADIQRQFSFEKFLADE